MGVKLLSRVAKDAAYIRLLLSVINIFILQRLIMPDIAREISSLMACRSAADSVALMFW